MCCAFIEPVMRLLGGHRINTLDSAITFKARSTAVPTQTLPKLHILVFHATDDDCLVLFFSLHRHRSPLVERSRCNGPNLDPVGVPCPA
jgi:hypothetical protein